MYSKRSYCDGFCRRSALTCSAKLTAALISALAARLSPAAATHRRSVIQTFKPIDARLEACCDQLQLQAGGCPPSRWTSDEAPQGGAVVRSARLTSCPPCALAHRSITYRRVNTFISHRLRALRADFDFHDPKHAYRATSTVLLKCHDFEGTLNLDSCGDHSEPGRHKIPLFCCCVSGSYQWDEKATRAAFLFEFYYRDLFFLSILTPGHKRTLRVRAGSHLQCIPRHAARQLPASFPRESRPGARVCHVARRNLRRKATSPSGDINGPIEGPLTEPIKLRTIMPVEASFRGRSKC